MLKERGTPFILSFDVKVPSKSLIKKTFKEMIMFCMMLMFSWSLINSIMRLIWFIVLHSIELLILWKDVSHIYLFI